MMSKASKDKDIVSDEPPTPRLQKFRDGVREPDPDLDETITVESGNWTYEFGESCAIHRPDGDDGSDKYDSEYIAGRVWPLQVYRHVDDDEFGIRFAYQDKAGNLRYGTVPGGATASKAAARNEASRQADAGVQIRTGKGGKLIRALGQWRDKTHDADVVTLTRTPGWHETCSIYVNGRGAVHGDDGDQWFPESDHPSIDRRSDRNGSADDWREAVERLVDTPALQVSLGTSLAGALIGYLGAESFMLHIYGQSSIGKSKAAELACSVWGSKRTHFNTWDATPKSVAALAQTADDSCFVVDDMSRFDGGDKQLGNVAYAVASGKERHRLERSGDLQDTATWNIAGLSTGERSLASAVGDHLKGGQTTRMVDLRIEQGESTRDGDHAKEMSRTFTEGNPPGVYGWAGDAWVSYLIAETDRKAVADSRRRWREGLEHHESDAPEEGRILDHLALVATALEHGRRAELLPWSDGEIEQTINWAAERVMEAREDERTPNERAYALLKKLTHTKPQRFPTESEADRKARDIAGYQKSAGSIDESGREIWTTPTMLEALGIFEKASASKRQFMKWCKREEYARQLENRQTVNGDRQRWYIFGEL